MLWQRLSTDDWDLVTEHGALLNKDGELTPPMFEKMLLSQIASFTRRKVLLLLCVCVCACVCVWLCLSLCHSANACV